MAYAIDYTLSVKWIPDGAGAMSVPTSQAKKFSATSTLIVPGADAPTQSNFNTVISGASATPTAPSMSNDLSAQIATALATIQAWATGGN